MQRLGEALRENPDGIRCESPPTYTKPWDTIDIRAQSQVRDPFSTITQVPKPPDSDLGSEGWGSSPPGRAASEAILLRHSQLDLPGFERVKRTLRAEKLSVLVCRLLGAC